MNPGVFILAEIAVLGGVGALLWIAASLHTLAAHAYEIICILDGSKHPVPASTRTTGERDEGA